jgi:hypothetical protein
VIIELEGPSAGVQKNPDGSGAIVFQDGRSGVTLIVKMTAHERAALRQALGDGPVIEMPQGLADAALRRGPAKVG